MEKSVASCIEQLNRRRVKKLLNKGDVGSFYVSEI